MRSSYARVVKMEDQRRGCINSASGLEQTSLVTMKTLSVICPVYNEENGIETFYQELKKVLNQLEYQHQIVMVVDKCTDRTSEKLRCLANQDSSLKVLLLSNRFGHQASLLAGMDFVDTDATIMMDADLQHPPSMIPKMLERFEEGYDLVYMIREQYQASLVRRQASQCFYQFLNTLSDTPIHVGAADFRLISKRLLHVFKYQIRERNMFLRGLFGWVGFKSVAMEFPMQLRQAGHSKYSVSRLLRLATTGIISFSKRPLQLSMYLGFGFSFLGFGYALLTLIQWWYLSSLPSGWTTLTILISLFSGTQLICIGILGNYIGAVFDEVKARPPYLVEETINSEV
jgi:glycosyltransferase involved in cell wall biosynthesis